MTPKKLTVKYVRTSACGLLICFVTSSFPVNLHAQSVPAPIQTQGIFPERISDVKIPKETGRIESFWQGADKKPAIILIQDAHAIPDAQKKIQNLIEYFAEQYGVKTVGVEGSAGKLDAQIFRSFPNRTVLEKVLSQYHQAGELTGPSAAALLGKNEGRFEGVEEWALYEEGYSLFRQAMRVEDGLKKQIDNEQVKIETRKEKTFSPELLKADKAILDLERNRTDFLTALKILSEIKKPEASSVLHEILEIIEIEKKSRDGESEEVIAQTQKRMQDLEGTKLIREFWVYSRSVLDALAVTGEQKRLLKESRFYLLHEKLAALELSRQEWEEAKKQILRSVQHDKSRFDLFQRHLEFYQNAVLREKAMARNFTEVLKNKRAGILVVGGFHAHGLARIFEQKGISYLLVRPEIYSLPENISYRDHMAGELSWKNYFRVENGKISFYEAFVRAARDRLLAASPSKLKAWRDQIILDLAAKEKISQAGEYTQFLDELLEKSDLKLRWKVNIERFMQSLRGLDKVGKLNEQNILNLLQPSMIPASSANILGSQSPMRTEAFHGELFTSTADKFARLRARRVDLTRPPAAHSELRADIVNDGKALELRKAIFHANYQSGADIPEEVKNLLLSLVPAEAQNVLGLTNPKHLPVWRMPNESYDPSSPSPQVIFHSYPAHEILSFGIKASSEPINIGYELRAHENVLAIGNGIFNLPKRIDVPDIFPGTKSLYVWLIRDSITPFARKLGFKTLQVEAQEQTVGALLSKIGFEKMEGKRDYWKLDLTRSEMRTSHAPDQNKEIRLQTALFKTAYASGDEIPEEVRKLLLSLIPEEAQTALGFAKHPPVWRTSNEDADSTRGRSIIFIPQREFNKFLLTITHPNSSKAAVFLQFFARDKSLIMGLGKFKLPEQITVPQIIPGTSSLYAWLLMDYVVPFAQQLGFETIQVEAVHDTTAELLSKIGFEKMEGENRYWTRDLTRAELRGGLVNPDWTGYFEKMRQSGHGELLNDVLAREGINADGFMEVIYPGAGNYENLMLSQLRKKVFNNIQAYHLISLSYQNISTAISVKTSLEAQLGENAQVLTYAQAYGREDLKFKTQGARIWIDKFPGHNGSMRENQGIYKIAVRAGHLRPGDLILTVLEGMPARVWKNQIASGVSIPGDNAFLSRHHWIVSIVTEEDLKEIQNSLRSELRAEKKIEVKPGNILSIKIEKNEKSYSVELSLSGSKPRSIRLQTRITDDMAATNLLRDISDIVRLRLGRAVWLSSSFDTLVDDIRLWVLERPEWDNLSLEGLRRLIQEEFTAEGTVSMTLDEEKIPWDSQSNQHPGDAAMAYFINLGDYHPDDRYIVSGARDGGRVHIWRIKKNSDSADERLQEIQDDRLRVPVNAWALAQVVGEEQVREQLSPRGYIDYSQEQRLRNRGENFPEDHRSLFIGNGIDIYPVLEARRGGLVYALDRRYGNFENPEIKFLLGASKLFGFDVPDVDSPLRFFSFDVLFGPDQQPLSAEDYSRRLGLPGSKNILAHISLMDFFIGGFDPGVPYSWDDFMSSLANSKRPEMASAERAQLFFKELVKLLKDGGTLEIDADVLENLNGERFTAHQILESVLQEGGYSFQKEPVGFTYQEKRPIYLYTVHKTRAELRSTMEPESTSLVVRFVEDYLLAGKRVPLSGRSEKRREPSWANKSELRNLKQDSQFFIPGTLEEEYWLLGRQLAFSLIYPPQKELSYFHLPTGKEITMEVDRSMQNLFSILFRFPGGTASVVVPQNYSGFFRDDLPANSGQGNFTNQAEETLAKVRASFEAAIDEEMPHLYNAGSVGGWLTKIQQEIKDSKTFEEVMRMNRMLRFYVRLILDTDSKADPDLYVQAKALFDELQERLLSFEPQEQPVSRTITPLKAADIAYSTAPGPRHVKEFPDLATRIHQATDRAGATFHADQEKITVSLGGDNLVVYVNQDIAFRHTLANGIEIAAVIDGVGGATRGDLASRLLERIFRESLGGLTPDMTDRQIIQALEKAAGDAGRAIDEELAAYRTFIKTLDDEIQRLTDALNSSSLQGDPAELNEQLREYQGVRNLMREVRGLNDTKHASGASFVLTVIFPQKDSQDIYGIQGGDLRAELLMPNNKYIPLTFNSLQPAEHAVRGFTTLTQAEKAFLPGNAGNVISNGIFAGKKNITTMPGGYRPVSFIAKGVKKDARLILMSDGIHKKVERNYVARGLSLKLPLDLKLKRLISDSFANGSDDDATILVLDRSELRAGELTKALKVIPGEPFVGEGSFPVFDNRNQSKARLFLPFLGRAGLKLMGLQFILSKHPEATVDAITTRYRIFFDRLNDWEQWTQAGGPKNEKLLADYANIESVRTKMNDQTGHNYKFFTFMEYLIGDLIARDKYQEVYNILLPYLLYIDSHWTSKTKAKPLPDQKNPGEDYSGIIQQLSNSLQDFLPGGIKTYYVPYNPESSTDKHQPMIAANRKAALIGDAVLDIAILKIMREGHLITEKDLSKTNIERIHGQIRKNEYLDGSLRILLGPDRKAANRVMMKVFKKPGKWAYVGTVVEAIIAQIYQDNEFIDRTGVAKVVEFVEEYILPAMRIKSARSELRENEADALTRALHPEKPELGSDLKSAAGKISAGEVRLDELEKILIQALDRALGEQAVTGSAKRDVLIHQSVKPMRDSLMKFFASKMKALSSNKQQRIILGLDAGKDSQAMKDYVQILTAYFTGEVDRLLLEGGVGSDLSGELKRRGISLSTINRMEKVSAALLDSQNKLYVVQDSDLFEVSVNPSVRRVGINATGNVNPEAAVMARFSQTLFAILATVSGQSAEELRKEFLEALVLRKNFLAQAELVLTFGPEGQVVINASVLEDLMVWRQSHEQTAMSA